MSEQDMMDAARERVEAAMHFPKYTMYWTQGEYGGATRLDGYYDEEGGDFVTKSGQLWLVTVLEVPPTDRKVHVILGVDSIIAELRPTPEEGGEFCRIAQLEAELAELRLEIIAATGQAQTALEENARQRRFIDDMYYNYGCVIGLCERLDAWRDEMEVSDG
jgi:hypothetical protein